MPPMPADPDGVVSELQSVLSALTNLELRHEIARDCLEDWAGPDELKRHFIARCEREYEQARAAHIALLARLRAQIGARHPTH
jgi:hypothetical protein